MKTKLIISTLVIASALGACSKDKKPAPADPAAAQPAGSDSAKTDPANGSAAGSAAKADDKPAAGGW